MLNLPPSTLLNKAIAKTALFAKGDIKAAARERFDADISRIAIVAELSPQTMAIEKGETIEAIFVVQVQLKREKYDPKNIGMLAKLIPQRIVFQLVFGEKARMVINAEKLLQSEWAKTENISLPIHGNNLDAVWANIVSQITNADNLIVQGEQQTKLQQKIDTLERRARSEKQPRRKFELIEEINRLKDTNN